MNERAKELSRQRILIAWNDPDDGKLRVVVWRNRASERLIKAALKNVEDMAKGHFINPRVYTVPKRLTVRKTPKEMVLSAPAELQ